MSDFVSPKGPGTFPTNASLEWRVFLRTNFLHSQLEPEDNIAFQEVCSEFNGPKAGRAMDPHGIVICVLAHALKWPPAVRHYQCRLRKLIATQGCQPGTLVDAFYETVFWADDKPLTEMHHILSAAGRAHALTGLAVTAQQLGIICSREPSGWEGKCRVVNLGPVGKTYFLRPREELANTEAVVALYIEAASKARLAWPSLNTPFEKFASDVYWLMVTCHSRESDGVGLLGGKRLPTD